MSVQTAPTFIHGLNPHAAPTKTALTTDTTLPWHGRVIAEAKHTIDSTAQAVKSMVGNVFYGMSLVVQDVNMLATVFRKLDQYILSAIEQLSKMPGYFTKCKLVLGNTVGVIDACDVVKDFAGWTTGEYKKGDQAVVWARTTGTVANAGGALLWLESMNFFDLGKIAASMGEMRVFKMVPKITAAIPYVRDISVIQKAAATIGNVHVFALVTKVPLVQVATRALTLTYALLAFDAMQRLINNGNHHQKIHAGMDLMRYASELALDAMVTFGMTNVLGLGAMAGACVTMAVTSYIYSSCYKNELQQPRELVISAL